MHAALIALFSVLSAASADTPGDAVAPVWSVVTVLPGETVESVASRFEVAADDVRQWSRLDSLEAPAGTRLAILSTVSEEERFKMTFRVKTDTTWQALAKRYEMPLDVLFKANGLRRGRQVNKGRRVTVYVKKSRWNRLFLDGGVQLVDGPGVVVKHPEWAWGRPVTVRAIEEAGALVAQRFEGAALVVGDISKRRGGVFKPHKAHKGGLDADIGLFVLEEPYRERFRHVKPSELDAKRTWFVVKLLIDTGRVERVLLDWYLQAVLYKHAQEAGVAPEVLEDLFQYPAKRWREKGLIRHWPGHKHHLHFRFVEQEGVPLL